MLDRVVRFRARNEMGSGGKKSSSSSGSEPYVRVPGTSLLFVEPSDQWQRKLETLNNGGRTFDCNSSSHIGLA